MRQRVRYDWKITDFIFNFFRLFSFLFCCINKKKNKLNVKKRLELYDKGETKFIKDFDAVYYARSIRNLTTLVTSMIDQNERFMISYQKTNAISLDSSTTSSHSDENYDGVPKLFAKEKKKLEHRNRVDEFMVNYNCLSYRRNTREKFGQGEILDYLMGFIIKRN